MKFEWTGSMTRKALTYIVAGAGIILVYFMMKNLDIVKGLWHSVRDILRPFTFGLIFAYLLNGPLMYFEKKLSFVEKTKPRRVLKRVLAITASWIATVVVLGAFFYIVMPDVTKSINVLIANIPHYLSNLQAFVGGIAQNYGIDVPFLDYFLEFRISSEVFATILKEYGQDLLPQLANITQRAGSPVLSPRIFGPITLPSSCWRTKTKIANQSACQGSTIRRIRIEGIAPRKGPKNGITLVQPTIKLISIVNSNPIMLIPKKQRIPIISESRSFPLIKLLKILWDSLANLTKPKAVSFLQTA